jgi:hypothetical protein
MHIKPPIWRRIVVPADVHLEKLHQIIQKAMGWERIHLYGFRIAEELYSSNDDSAGFGYGRDLEAKEYILEDLFPFKGQSFTYIYDFGDDWRHKITIEDTDYTPNPKKKQIIEDLDDYPVVCISGKRACPPEDVGGVWGYYNFCAAIKDFNHPNHEHYVEWYGGDDPNDPDFKTYDSEEFSLHSVNWHLRGILEMPYFRAFGQDS